MKRTMTPLLAILVTSIALLGTSPALAQLNDDGTSAGAASVGGPSVAGPGHGAPDLEDPGVNAPGTDDVTGDRDALVLLLSGYHGLPEAGVFEARFDDPRGSLLALLQEPVGNPIHYDRALAALAYWPNDEVRVVYDAHLAEPSRPMMVHHMLVNYVRAFGDDAFEAVVPYLQDEDVQVRLTVVEALRAHGSTLAVETLIDAEAHESHELVLTRIREATALR